MRAGLAGLGLLSGINRKDESRGQVCYRFYYNTDSLKKELLEVGDPFETFLPSSLQRASTSQEFFGWFREERARQS